MSDLRQSRDSAIWVEVKPGCFENSGNPGVTLRVVAAIASDAEGGIR